MYVSKIFYPAKGWEPAFHLGRKIIDPSCGYPPDETRFVTNGRRAPLPANEMNPTLRSARLSFARSVARRSLATNRMRSDLWPMGVERRFQPMR